jgi:hypothetical protein
LLRFVWRGLCAGDLETSATGSARPRHRLGSARPRHRLDHATGSITPQARLGSARLDHATGSTTPQARPRHRLGSARLGSARLGSARLGSARFAGNTQYDNSRAILAINCICGTMPWLHLWHDAVVAFAARCHGCICGTMPWLHLRNDMKLRWIESETTKGGSMQMRRDPDGIISEMQRAAFIPLALYSLLDTCRKRKILRQKPPPPKFFEPTCGFRKQKKAPNRRLPLAISRL